MSALGHATGDGLFDQHRAQMYSEQGQLQPLEAALCFK